jgi:hypothetical protein
MSNTTIRTQVNEPLNVHSDLLPKLALNAVGTLDNLAYASNLVISELKDPRRRIYLGRCNDLFGLRESDSVDIR